MDILHPNKFNKKFNEKWYILPITGALMVIATLPPVHAWWLCYISIAPIFLFARISTTYTWKRTALGGFLFSTIFTSFILSLTLLQFHWVKETYLFTYIIRLSSIVILLFFGVFASSQILIARTIRSSNSLIHIVFASSFWTLSEWLINKLLLGVEYSIIGYPASSTMFISLARYGGSYATIFAVTLINVSIGSFIYYIYKKDAEAHWQRNALLSLMVIVITFSLGYFSKIYLGYKIESSSIETIKANTTVTANNTTKTTKKLNRKIKVAIIQYQDTDIEPFGKEKIDPQTSLPYFSFPNLERRLLEIQKDQKDSDDPLFIIYPFAPWNGAIGTKSDKQVFDKKVIATDFDTFAEWTSNYIRKDNILVTWNTVYRDKKFFNEIHFWKNGQLVGYTQKNILFPFLDYTPALSARIGLYTTPIDSSSGTHTFKNTTSNVHIGALVCSEVSHPIKETTAVDTDVVFSIGSEALFTGGTAGEFNLSNATYRAVESGIPIVRANRFGPSGVIDASGTILQKLEYAHDGVLFQEFEVQKKTSRTPFEKGGQKVLLTALIGILAAILYQHFYHKTQIRKE